MHVLVGATVLIGVAQTASGSSASRLRASQSQQAKNNLGKGNRFNAGGGHASVQGRYGLPQQRSLKSTRDPQCNLPEAFPCTLNMTAIGMVESGFATFYDE